MRFFARSKQTMGSLDNRKNKSYTMGDGEKGSLDTVSLMKKIAREESQKIYVRDFALAILNLYQTQSHNHLDEAIAIATYIQKKVRYVKDIDNVEMLTQPSIFIKALIEGKKVYGDCDDISLLLATLLLSIGIKPMFKIVRWREDEGNFNHIYVVVEESNYKQKPVQTALDCIIKDKEIGSELNHRSYQLIKV